MRAETAGLERRTSAWLGFKHFQEFGGEEDENEGLYQFTWIKYILCGIDLTCRTYLMAFGIGVGF